MGNDARTYRPGLARAGEALPGATNGPTPGGPDMLGRVLAGISDALVTLDRDWHYTYVNPRAAEIAGLPGEAVLGRTIWELFPAVLGTELESACRTALASGQIQSFEYYYPPFDRWLEQRLYPTPDGLTILSTDITDRRRAEQKLRESEAELRSWLA
jgi:PAS domain S-box-containing protein